MKKTLRVLKWIVIGLIVVFLGIQFIRPARTNPAVDESQTIFARTFIFFFFFFFFVFFLTLWGWFFNVGWVPLPFFFFSSQHQ